MKIKLQKLKCKRCGYEWIPRKDEVRLCPRCRSPYWDKERKRGKNIGKNNNQNSLRKRK